MPLGTYVTIANGCVGLSGCDSGEKDCAAGITLRQAVVPIFQAQGPLPQAVVEIQPELHQTVDEENEQNYWVSSRLSIILQVLHHWSRLREDINQV